MVDVSLLYLLPAQSHTASPVLTTGKLCSTSSEAFTMLQCLLGTHYQQGQRGTCLRVGEGDPF